MTAKQMILAKYPKAHTIETNGHIELILPELNWTGKFSHTKQAWDSIARQLYGTQYHRYINS